MFKNPVKKLTAAITLAISCISTNIHAQQHTINHLDIVIDAPDGFTGAQNFNGLIQPETFSTIKYKEEVLAFESASQAYLTEIKNVLHQEKVTINDKTGILLKFEKNLHNNVFTHWSLLFGDSISTIIIESSSPKMMGEQLEQSLKQTLLSTRWLRLPKDQLFHGLPFVFDSTDKLSATTRSANSIILIDNSKTYDPAKSVAPLYVVSSSKTEQPIEEIEKFSKQMLKAKRLEDDIQIIKQQATKIAGIMAFHMQAKGIDRATGLEVGIYQTIAYQGKRFLLVQGLVEPKQAAEFWPQFEKITQSIKFKNEK